MNKFIEEHLEGCYRLTNLSVNNIKQDENINSNHLAKVLLEHCNNYKIIIDKLLKDEKNK